MNDLNINCKDVIEKEARGSNPWSKMFVCNSKAQTRMYLQSTKRFTQPFFF